MYLQYLKPRVISAIIAAILCAVFVLLFNAPVHAANGLTLSPPLRDITLGPGLLETSTEISLQNNTQDTITAHLQLVDLKSLGEFGGSSLDKAGLSDKYDLANWMSLPGGDAVVIAKGETVKVKVNIINRADLAPGGHYGAVVITSSGGNNVSSNVNISQQLASLLFVKKLGGEVYGLAMDPISYHGSSVPEQITTNFKSTGNVHVIPRGYIEVTDSAGKIVAKGILNPDSSIILPGASRRFVTLLQPVAPANRLGKYKISVHYRYDGQNEFQTQSVYFTRGIPAVRIAAAIVAGLGIVSVIFYGIRRKLQRS